MALSLCFWARGLVCPEYVSEHPVSTFLRQASHLHICDPVTEPRTGGYVISRGCRLLSHVTCSLRAGQPPPLSAESLSIFRQKSVLNPLPTAVLSGPSKCAQG